MSEDKYKILLKYIKNEHVEYYRIDDKFEAGVRQSFDKLFDDIHAIEIIKILGGFKMIVYGK